MKNTNQKQQELALNRKIERFIQEKQTPYTNEDRYFINQYTGYGGLVDVAPEEVGVLYEYYTPEILIDYTWACALNHYKAYLNDNIKPFSVLEPSAGVGRFLSRVPPNCTHKGYELSETSAAIARINGYNVECRNFLSLFVDRTGKALRPTEKYDIVIGNPPYGVFVGELTHFEKKATQAKDYIEYFILRGMEVLEPGGVLCYVLPQHFINGKWNDVRVSIAEHCAEIKTYRMADKYSTDTPVKGSDTFERTAVQIDVVVFVKK
jgi:nitrite reductase/ring-hydroxylating ferredoxin subunit